jgi:DNA-binding MarR family transcriptional regulator
MQASSQASSTPTPPSHIHHPGATAYSHVHSAAQPYQHRHPALDAIINVTNASEYFGLKLDRAVAPLGITGVQYKILRMLKRSHPIGMSRSEIVHQLPEKTVDVTRSTDGLVKLGMVERVRAEEDRRLSISIITEKGIGALEQVNPYFFTMLEEVNKLLSEEEFRALSALCEKLVRAAAEQEEKE